MLRCTVEIVPHGVEEATYPLYVFYIGNTSGCAELSNYAVYLNKDPRGENKAITRTCSVRKHRRADGALVLLKKIFGKIIKKEKTERTRLSMPQPTDTVDKLHEYIMKQDEELLKKLKD